MEERSARRLPNPELTQLKLNVLQSILNQRPFPGLNQPLHFPDLPFVLNQPEIYLVDPDIQEPLMLEQQRRTIQVVSAEAMARIAQTQGRVVFLQFEVSAPAADKIVLSLQAKSQAAFLDQRPVSLTSLQLEFRQGYSGWEISQQPISLSS